MKHKNCIALSEDGICELEMVKISNLDEDVGETCPIYDDYLEFINKPPIKGLEDLYNIISKILKEE